MRYRRWLARGLVALVLLLAALWATPLPPSLRDARRGLSLRLVDRNGELLREVLSSSQGVAQWRSLEQISPYLVEATLVSEDQRFFIHPGVDPLAILRAATANVRARRVLQGGSTLTQQLVRNLRGDQRRDLAGKVEEAWLAARLELAWSKREILEAYLNRIPYGSQSYGVEAASQFYFARGAERLSCAQAAFLAVLPRAPEAFQPYQDVDEILPLQRQLLQRMARSGKISAETLKLALAEPIELQAAPGFFEAGHYCDYVMSQGIKEIPEGAVRGTLVTTLDLPLQKEIEEILRTHVERLAHNNVGNGAVVVLDVVQGDILAMVGSTDYQRSQFNAALAGRQPGSALKPFTYELALERDKTASSLLPDLNLYPRQIANGYIPRNYDEKFHGPVRLRTALACSYNVPVVRVLEELGTDALLRRLRLLGFERLRERAEHYGLGLTLGDGEVTLLELANAYRALARAGQAARPRWWSEQEPNRHPRAVMEPRCCAVMTDILKDPLERIDAFGRTTPLNLPFECAAKTGTSKGYRDNWTVGYTPRYAVAVWIGNLDGTSMKAVSGISGAGPVFRDVFLALERRDGASPRFILPEGLQRLEICPVSGDLPGPDCPTQILEYFLQERPPAQTCQVHRRVGGGVMLDFPPLYRSWMIEQGLPLPPPPARAQDSVPRAAVHIAYPDGNSVFRRDPILRQEHQQIHFRAVVPSETQRVTWEIDGKAFPVGEPPFGLWWTLTEGSHRAVVRAQDSSGRQLGRSEIVHFRVK